VALCGQAGRLSHRCWRTRGVKPGVSPNVGQWRFVDRRDACPTVVGGHVTTNPVFRPMSASGALWTGGTPVPPLLADMWRQSESFGTCLPTKVGQASRLSTKQHQSIYLGHSLAEMVPPLLADMWRQSQSFGTCLPTEVGQASRLSTKHHNLVSRTPAPRWPSRRDRSLL
jgi:hypothetical protein